MIKALIRARLEHYVKKYFKRHPEVKLVVVAGSVGKTSTKIAIGTVLSERFRVRLHEGNHNSELSAPLAMLGIDFPSNLRHIGHWHTAFKAIRRRIAEPADVDVIVQELGTDRIGQIPRFGKYLHPDIAVVTSVSAEHMEYFGTLDAVAKEELSAANFSKLALINRDDIAGEYAQYITNAALDTYGTTPVAEYSVTLQGMSATEDSGARMQVVCTVPEWTETLSARVNLLGEHSFRAAIAAVAVGVKLGMTPEEVTRGLEKVRAVSGRMNVLRGVNNTTIIDDTYNSSPLAAKSALQALYSFAAPQRIAVLGSMNELGATSAAEHEALGKLCDPAELTHVITVGEEAEKYLAPAARARGCHVVSFKSPLSAGAYAHKVLEPGSVLLFKGSQGGIFLEEAVKVVLHSTDDESQLVRQSAQWRARKQAYFDTLTPGA